MKNFHCREIGDYTNLDECESCECVNPEDGCEIYDKHYAEFNRAKKLKEEIEASEVFKTVSESLKNQLGVSDKAVAAITYNLVEDSVSKFESELRSMFSVLFESYAKITMEKMISEKLKILFNDFLEEEMTTLSETFEVGKTSFSEIITDKMKRFFAVKDRRGNVDVKSAFNDIIEKKAGTMFEEAFEELKAESIDKFNKEAMKAMMRGMAGGLANDQKLLNILTQ